MKIVEDFKKFVLRGNLAEMAIGFTVGAAFTTVAKSLVSNIIMPPIGLVLGGMDFTDLFLVLKSTVELPPNPTLSQAQAAGAVTLNYGAFIGDVVALLIVAVVMFLMIRAINRIDEALDNQPGDSEAETPTNKKCPFCRETIAFAASRCPQCTSQLEKTAVSGG